MQTAIKPSSKNRKGYALIIVLVFLGVTLAVMGSVMAWTASSSKQVERNNEFETSEVAADAAVENVITYMNRDFLNQALNSSNYYTTNLPTETGWPVAYHFSSTVGTNKTYVGIGSTSTNLIPLTSAFSGLQGYEQDVKIISTATPSGELYNVPATVTNWVQYDSIPIFQFAIFYQINMEIDPGATMKVTGPVYCNASIWAGNANLTFLSSVHAVGVISTASTDPFSKNYTGSPTAHFNVAPLTNQPALTMPIAGTNTSAAAVQNILNPPPSGDGAPNSAYLTTSNQLYLFNEADLIISNSASGINGNANYGTNITIWYNNTNNGPNYLSLITNDVVQPVPILVPILATNSITHKVTTNGFSTNGFSTTNLFYSFVTNVTFTDYRENDTVQALQIDVGKFDQWLTNTAPGGGNPWNLKNTTGSTSKGHSIDSIYLYNHAPMSSSQLPAVRVTDGAQLPSSYGLTIATPWPLYVQGDYNIQTNTSGGSSKGTTNTAYTYPAALMGDSVTILSDNWKDSVTSKLPSATATTINAATLEGIVATSSTISGDYSGGTENFLRLLENWSGVTLTYNGSIIVMFTSQYATNHWSYGTYYTAPNRNWAFDNNFTNQSGMPPLTPSVKSLLRTPGAWSAN
jgi:hypothetical protein